MNLKPALEKLLKYEDLLGEEMQQVMTEIMTGKSSDPQIAGFIVALRMKGETVEELSSAVTAMQKLAEKVTINRPNLVDIVGTGGDGLNTFNVSTTTCFVAAAAGATIAKHGNRAVSSNSGSADLLEQAGVNIYLSPQQVSHCVETLGIGFMFAPQHHSAMKYARNVRKALATRTLFNLLGPLTNPAQTQRQVIGVYHQRWLEPVALTLKRLGSLHAMVVHSRDGMDEISVSAISDVCELSQGNIKHYQIDPKDYDLYHPSLSPIVVDSSQQSLSHFFSVLHNQPGPAKDIVILNAAAALFVAGCCKDYTSGISLAKQAIASGAALKTFEALKKFSHEVSDE